MVIRVLEKGRLTSDKPTLWKNERRENAMENGKSKGLIRAKMKMLNETAAVSAVFKKHAALHFQRQWER